MRLGTVSTSESASLTDPNATLTTAVDQFYRFYEKNDDGVFRNESDDELVVMTASSDSLWLRFSKSINGGLRKSACSCRSQFESQSFREGIEFGSFVRSSEGEEEFFNGSILHRKMQPN